MREKGEVERRRGAHYWHAFQTHSSCMNIMTKAKKPAPKVYLRRNPTNYYKLYRRGGAGTAEASRP